jgi:uncharacterized protein
MLSDHYDPQSKTLRLSPEVYYTPSLAAAGIAAHETGHALQDAAGYLPLKARSLIVPAVQLSVKVAPWLFIAGVLFGANSLAWAAVILFGAQTLFTLITLPVEFDASARAQQLLISQGIIRGEQPITQPLVPIEPLAISILKTQHLRRKSLPMRRVMMLAAAAVAAATLAKAEERP